MKFKKETKSRDLKTFNKYLAYRFVLNILINKNWSLDKLCII